MMHHHEKGYTLIVSVVIISTLLLLAAVVTARQLQDGFFTSVRVDDHLQARLLAEGCMDAALLSIAIDGDYAGGEILTIQSEPCTVRPVVNDVLEVEAQHDDQWYRLRTTLSSTNPMVISRWERVTSW